MIPVPGVYMIRNRTTAQDGGRSTMDRRAPNLRILRMLAALTQEQLADKAGLQRPTITRLENGGEARPSTIRRLADALGCQPRDLLQSSRLADGSK